MFELSKLAVMKLDDSDDGGHSSPPSNCVDVRVVRSMRLPPTGGPASTASQQRVVGSGVMRL
jgi:hypothetical protein